MPLYLWLVIVWGTGLAGVIAAGFGIAIVNVDIMTRIQGTPLEHRLRETRHTSGFAIWDMMGYHALNTRGIASERPLPAGLLKDLKTLRRLELAMLCALLPCAGVLVGCWIIAAH